MSASLLNKCDCAKQILYHKIITDGLKVHILKIQYVRDKTAPTLFETTNKKFQFCLLSDDADSAKQASNTNNQANLDISAKSVCVVFLRTQRKGLMKKK